MVIPGATASMIGDITLGIIGVVTTPDIEVTAIIIILTTTAATAVLCWGPTGRMASPFTIGTDRRCDPDRAAAMH